jgi:hypothetical protein
MIVRVTDRATGKIVFNDKVDALHEEKIAKLKCDSLETRARVMATALKTVLVKATQAVLKARSPTTAPATT